MTSSMTVPLPDVGDYQNCYVAFLDILGFRQLVERSVIDPKLLTQISGITITAATPKSGIKQTSYGPCPMQVRSFSDSFVVFTPMNHKDQNDCNPLGQLCFLVRYIHDRVLEMDACVRGGLASGKMYWHPSWWKKRSRVNRSSRGALPITFGPGLHVAYDLESKCAIYPRVLVDETIVNSLNGASPTSWPYGKGTEPLKDLIRNDPRDGKHHLDLLNPDILRAKGEKMQTSESGFTVAWKSGSPQSYASILQKAKTKAEAGLVEFRNREKERLKYEWLKEYCDSV